ncbi:MAG: hypothetical protein EA351_02505 [Gemmatimonadales bacterium]|nr:MAG: hypothetical protein EA351_02505 [Gemmatimonadales bacterium]
MARRGRSDPSGVLMCGFPEAAAPTRFRGNVLRARTLRSPLAVVWLALALVAAGCGSEPESNLRASGETPSSGDSAAAGMTDSRPEVSAETSPGSERSADAPARASELPATSDTSAGASGEGVPASGSARAAASDRPRPVRPDSIRGIYLNAWRAGSRSRVDAALDLVRRTEINTLVVDVKDATGYMSYATDVPLAGVIGADDEIRIRDLPARLDRLADEGIYPIARIVVFKDPLLAERRPEMAVQDSTGAPWVDGKGDRWVNPWDRRIWEYHLEIAREAVALGFPEIQWDYIRFPDRPASEMEQARFPGAEGRAKSEAVRGFLIYTREGLADLDVPVTADVFGVATAARTDVGIGQLWEDMTDVTDALLPMVYPSHYWRGSYGFEVPNAHPYEVVRRALEDGIRRNREVEDPAEIIPWLQDFTLGDPPYGVPEVRAQILAVEDLGIPHWILWNASGRYTEGALRPIDGWGPGGEPAIRFGGGVVPASDRRRSPVVDH